MQYTDNYQFRKPTRGVDEAKIDDLNFNADRYDTLIHDSQISLAPAYDSTQSYDTDDVVMYEFLMYKCKEDNVTGAWDATKWERTTASEVGSGGGGGSSVVPNPQGSATDTLTKIEIDGTIYDIEGSGGGGGGAFTVTDLYDIGDASLSDSIDNYDMLAVYYGVESEFSSLSDYKIFTVDDVKEMYTAGKWLICTGYSTRVVYFKINGTTLTIGTSEGSQAILKIRGIKCGGSSGGTTSEIIPITAGDGTTSRTFTLSKTPKSVTMQGYTSGEGGCYESGYFIWGENFINLYGAQGSSATGGYVGQASITYGQDGKSFTITAVNAFGAFNRSDGWVGNMLVDYGESGGGSSEDIADMTWTLLTSTTGTSSATAIPSGTKYLVLTAELGGYVSMVAKESIATIEKLATVAGATFNQGYEYADIAGNHTTIAMSVSSGDVTIKSGYNTVTTKVYAIS